MEGIIKIFGLIGNCGDSEEDKGIELVDIISQVKAQPSANSFKVFIDSEGGNVSTGYDIYNYLKGLKKPIHTIGRGMVASVATVVFMAGDTRTTEENCIFMIHCPMGNPQWLTADEMADYAKQVKDTENKMVKFYSEHTGLETEAIFPMLRNETFLSVEQLKSLGFTTGDAPLRIAAKANININQNKDKMSKESETLLKAIFDAVVKGKGKGKKNKDIVNLILFTATQGEVDFYELEEDAEVVTGAKARIDGKDAEGDIVMSDGRTFKFTAGELMEIVEAEEDDDDTIDAELAAAQAEVEDLTGEVETLTAEVARLKKEAKANKKIIDRIEALRSKYEEEEVDESKKKGGKQAKKKQQSRFKKALSNVKKEN